MQDLAFSTAWCMGIRCSSTVRFLAGPDMRVPLRPLLQHCAGINSLILSADEQHLWTASRDSLIKR